MFTAPSTSSLGALGTIAAEELERGWQRMKARLKEGGQPLYAEKMGEPPMWLLPELLAIVEEFHDRPVEEIAPLIGRLVVDQEFVDHNGDAIPDSLDPQGVRQRVVMLVEVLERVRRQALEQGLWCSVPVTPLMCG